MLSIKLLFCVLLYFLTCSHQYHIPARDYERNNYFVVELNTTHSQKPLIDFISQYKNDYKFEHQVNSMDNFYVFSIDKSHPHNTVLGNHNSNNYKLLKRSEEFQDVYDHLTNNVQSLHLLEPKKLNKRLPIFHQELDSSIDTRDSEPQAAQQQSPSDKAHQRLAEVASKLDIHDPEFSKQWHLLNLQYPGHDINVTGLWLDGVFGEGITTAIIDDGLDAESEDLKDNFNAKGSWDFNDNGNIPLPRLYDDYHGTRCAGEIAAVKNDVCGVGVAYKSKVAGIRILSGGITAAEEAAAMVFGLDTNDIYSCSWGPTDNGKTLSEPENIVKQAMIRGIQEGRDNKGAIYVFASGNGGRYSDSCNFDGYTNSIYSITIGAIDYKGEHPIYSEACSAVMVVTYSSGSGEHIHTTDIKKKCSALHGGTSAAAPIASGIYSLILGANPNLTWRDLQYINVLSATPVNENDGNYQKTALGRLYSHRYGYGKTDAYKMVEFAKTWKNVKPQSWYYSDVVEVNQKISLNHGNPNLGKRDGEGDETPTKLIKSTVTVTKDDLEVMNVEKVEHITVKVNINSSFRGKVGVRLVSPLGVVSDLATFRPGDMSSRGFQDWTFMSVAHWGEDGLGDWQIEVFADDSRPDSLDIEFRNWQFRIFGVSIDADKAEKYELQKDYALVRRERLEEKKEKEKEKETTTSSSSSSSSTTTTTSSSSTTETPTPSTTSSLTTEKPSSADTTSTDAGSLSSSVTTPTDHNEDQVETGEPDEPSEGKNRETSDHTGQYFMALAIVGFIIIILIMKYHKSPTSGRRRRRRNNEFEFDIIPGEDYTDSEDEGDDDDDSDLEGSGRRAQRDQNQHRRDQDSLDLGQRNDLASDKNYKKKDDEARERLFEQFNAETLPDYDDDRMFDIGGEEEEDEDEQGSANDGDDRLTSSSQLKKSDVKKETIFDSEVDATINLESVENKADDGHSEEGK